MSKFCNNDTTLKMKHTRKAPDIELDEFKEYLTDYYNMFAGLGDAEEYPFDMAENEEFIKAVYPGRYSTDFPQFSSDFHFLSNSEEDPKVMAHDPENTLMGIHMLSNGLPVYGFTMGGDEELPYFAIMYWNGDHFRFYIPTYGNTYNVDLNTSFMNEGAACVTQDEIVECVDTYESALGKQLNEIDCPGASSDQKEMLQAAVAYCLVKHYADTEAEAMKVMNTVSWEAIQDDIISNIEITDEIEDDRPISEREFFKRTKKHSEEEEEISKKLFASFGEEDDEDDEDDEDEDPYSAEEEEDEDEDEEEEYIVKPSAPKKTHCEEDDDWIYEDDEDDEDDVSPKTHAGEKIVTIDDVTSPANSFCNSDKSYIRIAKNKAVCISLDKFKQEIDKFYKDETAGTIYEGEEMDPDVLVESLLTKSTVKNNLRVFGSAIDNSDIKNIDTGEGNNLIGYHTLPNGVSILGFQVNDGGGNVYGCAFFDGDGIKTYIPNYGNTIHSDSGTSFDNCGKHMNEFMVKKYESILGEDIKKDEKGFYDSEQLTKAYFLSNGYDESDIKTAKKTICWQAILKDLIFSMTV